jgi:23S rRNA pseudouridine955/2504/2580 synthase/23S rRNA pseudouridine1911/1915/1917 synthase
VKANPAVNPVIKLSSPTTREFWQIPVLYEDEHLLALDKPAGLLTSPDRADPQRPSLMGLLHQGIADQKSWVREHGIAYLASAHRLDREASGIVLLARSKAVLVSLADLFGGDKPLKEYLALVEGAPSEPHLQIDARLAPDPVRPGIMRVDPKHGKRSRTLVDLGEAFGRWSLLRCRPLPDRAHQIRTHLRRAGCPVVGDELYGGRPLWLSEIKPAYRLKPGRQERPLLSRAALHAHTLSLVHPVTGAALHIVAPMPKDFHVALKYLRRFMSGGAPSHPPDGLGFRSVERQ